MMRLFLLLTLCGLVLTGSAFAQMDETPPASPAEFHTQELGRWRNVIESRAQYTLDETQADYDALYYELWIDLRNFAGQQITGHTNIHGRALVANFNEVVLDLCDTLTVDSVRGALNEVLSYTRGGQQITVSLERDYALNESFMLTIYYHGHPCLGGGISTFDWWNRPVSSYNVPSIATLSEPIGARDWWPCKDVPLDKPDSARIHLIVVDSLTATSNGLLENITPVPTGARQFNWFEKYPIATYLICASASNYVSFTNWYHAQNGDSMPLAYYVYPEKLAASQTDFSIMDDAISLLASKFGEYPFIEEKYGHSMFRWGGAMEHQCNTSYGRGLVTGFHTYDYILVHELAHQWWGDMVTMSDWPDIWLNEGFASYCEALWFEHLGGASSYRNYMNNNLTVNDPSGPVYNPTELFDGNTVYHKGAWVLHTLRGAIRNDSLFFAGMAEYRTRYEGASAYTPEFLDAMSDVVGYDVTPFVSGYIYEVNRPLYRVSYGTGVVDGVQTTAVRLRQLHTTPPVAFTNKCDLRFGGAQTVTQTVVCNSYRQEYLFQMGYSPTSITFDPDSWFLKTVLTEPLAVIFLNGSLSTGLENSSYADTLVALGGNGNYSFSLIGGTLPNGIALGANGRFSGTPTVGGSFPLTLRVQDTNNQADTTQLVLNVTPVIAPPQELTIVANGDNTVTLRWLSVPNAESYEVSYATQADFSDLTILATVTTTSYIDTVTGGQRFYVVRANGS